MTTGCATATCLDSETCCVEAHPGNPAACGLTAGEAAALMGATAGAGTAAAITSSQAKEDEFAHNAHLPEWKQRCIRAWNDCADGRLDGPCTACLRRCEGQHEWPADMCGPKPRKR
ncbi:hypothetical protein D7Y04_25490 [Corallococcus sp. AB038B]|nr:hypothetical protein D7Y04_25490 [Corallococcus sp. AB038B]